LIDAEPVGENENQTAIRLPGLDRGWATPVRRSPAGAMERRLADLADHHEGGQENRLQRDDEG
jgi:hypothetical protein